MVTARFFCHFDALMSFLFLAVVVVVDGGSGGGGGGWMDGDGDGGGRLLWSSGRMYCRNWSGMVGWVTWGRRDVLTARVGGSNSGEVRVFSFHNVIPV